jgi:uncharacterized protein (TIGR03435 family)
MLGATGAVAQSPESQPSNKLEFDVVSIKPVAAARIPLILGSTCLIRGARFICPASTLQQLIGMAFRFGDVAVPRSQIAGGPNWIATSRFEITAVLNAASEREQFATRVPALLRGLLEDRFKLGTHVERRPLPVYALVRALDDGRLGPRLRPAATNCPSVPGEMGAKRPAVPPAQAARDEKACFGGSTQPGSVRSGAMTMGALARYFTNFDGTDRIVLDRTDLIGDFEVDLRWSPIPPSAVVDAGAAHADSLDQPSLFAALREQLGLKLEPRTEVMDVLVIDRVELPSPN